MRLSRWRDRPHGYGLRGLLHRGGTRPDVARGAEDRGGGRPLGAQGSSRIRELLEERGCELLLYLPPYSPDLNPIEEAFSKIKGILRKVGARSRESLIEAMGRALDAITPRDARVFFEHCGYRMLVQPF